MSDQNQFLLYTAPDGAVKVDLFLKDETVWLTQMALAELFGVNVPAINKHLKNIFESGELTREATVSKMEIVRAEGGREVARDVGFYRQRQDADYVSDFDREIKRIEGRKP